MVDVLGHLGMALIWLAPAWFFVRRDETAATVVAVGFWFGMLPDIDLLLSNVFPTIKHHGVTHTILFATVAAIVLGPILGWILKRALGGTKWFSDEAAHEALTIGTILVWVAVLSHVFADMLSAPDIAEAVEPFWPLYQGSVGIDLVWYNAAWFNWGLVVAGVLLNVAFWYWTRDETRERGSPA